MPNLVEAQPAGGPLASSDCVRYNRSMRGGKREGAGRPPVVEGQVMWRVTIRLPQDLLEWIRREGDGNVSLGLRRVLEELDERRGADAQAAGARNGR